MRTALMIVFVVIFLAMFGLVVRASLNEGMLQALEVLWPDPWFQATIADTYFAFLTIWLWVSWRERSWLIRLLWLLLFFGLGNLAIAAYVLLQLKKLPPGAGIAGLFRPVPAKPEAGAR